jgi:hypothetical protein
MMTKILAVLVATATSHAWADPAPTVDQRRDLAVKHERDAGVRVDYYAKQTMIAERERAAAEITIDMALTQLQEALRTNDAKAARYWTDRHRVAAAEAFEAKARAARFRAERDRARDAFEASAADVRRLRDRG